MRREEGGGRGRVSTESIEGGTGGGEGGKGESDYLYIFYYCFD